MQQRGLSMTEAAVYVGISRSKFAELVAEGQMPRPFRLGRRLIWDKNKLDETFDLLTEGDDQSWADFEIDK